MEADDAAAGDRQRLHDELSRLEEDLLYTEKVHFAAAEAFGRVHLILGLTATLASAAAATTLMAGAVPWLSGALALVAALASGVLTFVKPDKHSSQHSQSGRALGGLRVQVRQARVVELPSRNAPKNSVEWMEALKKLADRKAEIEGTSPATSEWMLRTARGKIDRGDFEHASTRSPEVN